MMLSHNWSHHENTGIAYISICVLSRLNKHKIHTQYKLFGGCSSIYYTNGQKYESHKH